MRICNTEREICIRSIERRRMPRTCAMDARDCKYCK